MISIQRIPQSSKNLIYESFVKSITDHQWACINPHRTYPWFYIKHDDQIAGVLVCRLERKTDGLAGYIQTVVDVGFRGQGCANSAWCLFDYFPELDYLVSLVHKKNIASHKARQKTGFRMTGLRGHLSIFKLTREEYNLLR